MALTNIGFTPPNSTRASRFFTMVDINQGNKAEAVRQDYEDFVITDLVVAGPQGQSTYMPNNQSSAYAPGTINSLLFGPGESQYGWVNTAPLRNDAVVNQQNFLNSLGSVVMSFNLSENMNALRDSIEESIPETETRDAMTITREIEEAICESVIKPKEDFVNDIVLIYRELWSETQVLGEIYNEMQFISTFQNNSYDGAEGLVDWEALANGIDPMRRIQEAEASAGNDPIASTNLVAHSVTPPASPGIENTAPLIVQYVETSPTIQNAVLVNNLVITDLVNPTDIDMALNQRESPRSPTQPRRGTRNDY